MKFEIKGTIHTVFEAKQISSSFTKREFVLEIEDGRYSQVVMFEMTGDKVGQLDEYRKGDQVTVHFNLRGREWNSPKGEIKYFNSLVAWKVDRDGAQPSRGGAHDSPPPADEWNDDIPFASSSASAEPSPIARCLR